MRREARGAEIREVWLSAKCSAIRFSSRLFSYEEWGFTAMAANRAVSSHLDRVGLLGSGGPDSVIMWQGQWYSSARVAKHTHGETARCAGMRGMSQRSFGAVAVLTARDCRARLEGSSSSSWASVAMARHPVGGGGCGAHRGHGASPPVRSAENVFRRQAG